MIHQKFRIMVIDAHKKYNAFWVYFISIVKNKAQTGYIFFSKIFFSLKNINNVLSKLLFFERFTTFEDVLGRSRIITFYKSVLRQFFLLYKNIFKMYCVIKFLKCLANYC
jgi:hypothetical protein